ncbi:MAG: hypothetical protein AAF211_03260 [Myxococcota bacterium]
MQLHPDLVDGYTTGGGPAPSENNFSVAHLFTRVGSTLIGKTVFDRTSAPDPATPFGRDTDSWHWLTAGEEWPSAGFRLRIGTNPTYELVSGDYAIWDDSPFVSTTTEPPTTDRYRVIRVNSDTTETVMGELLVEEAEGEWRQTWWAEEATLVQDRLHFEADTDYRFDPISGRTTLDTRTLWICECPLTPLVSITV